MKKPLLEFFKVARKVLGVFTLLVSIPFLSNAQEVTVTNTAVVESFRANAPDINTTISSSCPFTFTVEIPEGNVILASNFTYTFTTTGGGAWTADQRSFVRVVGGNATPLQVGTGSAGGSQVYNIQNSNIASGLGGTVTFELHLFRTFGGTVGDCGVDHNVVQANAFTATIVYADPNICSAPAGLLVSNIGPSSAEVSWISAQEDFELSVGPVGHTPGSELTFTVDDALSFLATGLEPSTNYEAFVRSNCGDGTFSDWSSGVLFTTAVCAIPTDLNIFAGATTAQVFFQANGIDFEISVGAVGHTPGTGSISVIQGATSGEISDLMPNTQYEAFVRNVCSSTTQSSWSTGFVFSTICDDLVHNLSTPYFEDFEGACVPWQRFNGTAVNQWHVGDDESFEGDKSMYISNDNGANNFYNITSFSVVHFFKDFEVPEGLTEIFVTFRWKNQGQTTQDIMRVYTTPVNYLPPNITTGFLPGNLTAQGIRWLNLQSLAQQNEWQTFTVQLPQDFEGTTFRLLFSWRNDATLGEQPPAAVDNISVSAQPTPGKDLQALSVIPPADVCINQPNNVGVRVLNYGTEDLDFAINPVTFTINVTDPTETTVSLSATLNEGFLESGEEFIGFVPFTPTSPGVHNFRGLVDMVGDEIEGNNGPTNQINRTILPVVETPSEVLFDTYTGGNISALNADWTSAQGFTLRSLPAHETHFGGVRTVRQAMQFANATGRIRSPFFEVAEGDVTIFVAALTQASNGNEAHPMLPGDSVYVAVITCGSDELETIWVANPGNNPLTNNLLPYTVSLDDYVGQTIRLEYGARTVLASTTDQLRTNNIHFGEFFVGPEPDCDRPTSLNAEFIVNDEGEECIELSWEPGSDDQFIFEVVWGDAGFDPSSGDGNVIEVVFEGNSTLLCGIPAGVNFDFYVRANCGIVGFSTFGGPRSFIIPPFGSSCERVLPITELPFLSTVPSALPFGIFHNNTDVTPMESCAAAAFYMNGLEVVYEFTPAESGAYLVSLFGLAQSSTALWVTEGCVGEGASCIASVGRFDQLPRELFVELEAGTSYNIIVSRSTATGTLIDFTFSLSVEFLPCPPPQDVTISPVDLTTVQVNFDEFGNDNFEVVYGLAGFDPEVAGSTATGTVSPIVIDNLISGETYDFYVRSVCADGNSNFVGPLSFLMPQVGSVCQTPIVIESVPFLASGIEASPFGSFHNADQVNQMTACAAASFYMNGFEVVYQFTPAVSGAYEVRSFSLSESSTALWVMEGCPGPGGVCLASVGRFDQLDRELLVLLEAGTPYTIIVSRSTLNANFTFSLEINLIDCPEPDSFSAATGSTGEVEFVWNGFTGVEFDLIWGPTGFNPNTEGTLISGITAQTQVVSGLDDFQTICGFVRNVCEEGVTEWVGPVCANSPCGSFPIPFEDDFGPENGNFPCWSAGVTNWQLHTTNVAGVSALLGSSWSGWPMLRFNWTPTIVNYNEPIVSPVIDCTVEDAVEGEDYVILLEMEYVWDNFSIANQNFLSIEWRVEGGPWQLLEFFDSADLPTANANVYYPISRVLSGAGNNLIQIRLRAHGVNSGSLNGHYFDDVKVTANSEIVSVPDIAMEKVGFKAFPNPTSDIVNLVAPFNAPNAHIEVFDVNGKMVFNKKSNLITGEPHQLNFAGLQQGMYNIRITTPNSVDFTRIIVR
ncbi:MAG: T9SS type A sorting domain-containing protein [Luteibaculaceae bacterium]